jgi:hypothetical protein
MANCYIKRTENIFYSKIEASKTEQCNCMMIVHQRRSSNMHEPATGTATHLYAATLRFVGELQKVVPESAD